MARVLVSLLLPLALCAQVPVEIYGDEPPGPPTMTSTYVKFAECEPLGEGVVCGSLEGYSVVGAMTGSGDMTAIESADGALRRYLEADGCPTNTTDRKAGAAMEVRRAEGVPMAVILRTTCRDEGGARLGEFLRVVGLVGHGFLDVEVDVTTTPDANVRARQLADEEAALTPLGALYGTTVMVEQDPKVPPPAELLRRAAELKGKDGHLSWCLALVGRSLADESERGCLVRASADGRVALVITQDGCGGDRCFVSAWAVREAGSRLRLVGDDPWALTPSGDAIFSTFPLIPVGSAAYSVPLRTMRIDVATGAIEPFAACFSPAVSPGGKWVLCRNEDGDVLRVPIAGGRAEMAWDSGVGRNDIIWHAAIFPGPPVFRGDRVVVTVVQEGAERGVTHELAWDEQTGRLAPRQ